MSALWQDFHARVDFLTGLLAAAAAADTSQSTKPRHYDIRRCAREIHGILKNEELVIPSATSNDAMPPHGCSEAQNEATTRLYEQATSDLVNLITLEHQCNDPSTAELIDSLCPMALSLLETAHHLSPVLLQAVLGRALNLMQTHSHKDGLISDILTLFNRYAATPDQLQVVLANDDYSLFLALHVALDFVHSSAPSHDPAMAFLGANNGHAVLELPPPSSAVLIGSLLEYWTLHRMKANTLMPSQNLNHWLQNQFLSQSTSDIPSNTNDATQVLRQEVQAYVASLEDYGNLLIESTLQLLELSGRPHVQDTSGGENFQMGGTTGGNLSGATCSQSTLDPMFFEEDYTVTVLQYATLATNFIHAVQGTNLYPQPRMQAMSRSLWRELVHFLVHCIGDGGSPHGLAFVSLSDSAPSPEILPSLDLEYQTAATSTLWRLACLQRTQPAPLDDHPMVVATLLRVWKYAPPGISWQAQNDGQPLQGETTSIQEWLHGHLFPESASPLTLEEEEERTRAIQSLRRSLQGILLSYMSFPAKEYATEPLNVLSELLFPSLADDSGQGSPEAEQVTHNGTLKDPWDSWVLEQLSSS